MFRLAFLAACLLYLWLGSLFIQTSHVVQGDHHVFGYNWAAYVHGFCFNLIPIGGGWFLWKVKKDRVGAVIILLCIPLFAVFILPQYFMERVEVTSMQLSYRREPPHTKYNADIAFDDIASATERDFQTGLKGYIIRLKDGRSLELPASTVLTAARPVIETQFETRHIPVKSETVLPASN